MARVIVTQSNNPLDEGPHHAVVYAVNDLGEQPGYQGEDSRWQYGIGFEFPADPNGDGKPRTQWVTVNATLHPKSTLGKLVNAAGVVIPCGGEFDPAALVGANVTAMVEHIEKENQTYSNLVGFSRLPKTMTPVQPQHSPTTDMPDWLKTKLRNRLDKQQTSAVGSGW